MSTPSGEGAGTTSVPAPAVGPDGQTLTIACQGCDGAGVVPEDHGMGHVELLGCPECCHPDEADAGDGQVWRLHLVQPSPGGPWVLHDKLMPTFTREGPSRMEARVWLRQKERAMTLLAEGNAEAAVVAAARRWLADRLEGQVLGVDDDLHQAVAALERVIAAYEVLIDHEAAASPDGR